MVDAGHHINNIPEKLGKVFSDTDSHLTIAKIIKSHLTNKQDIREIAFNKLDLSFAKKIIDLGCGFGYFTKALKNRVGMEAEITGIDRHPQYKHLYLASCSEAGIKGSFYGKGISYLEKLSHNSYDLIICSYALYFFPEYIEIISRLLKKDGVFIIISHAIPHMEEFTSYIKTLVREQLQESNSPLPYESLIKNFSDKNGPDLLTPWFRKIDGYKINSKLSFTYKDFNNFKKYFKFKASFFLSGDKSVQKTLTKLILEKVKLHLKETGIFSISKKDIIFICSQPRYLFEYS